MRGLLKWVVRIIALVVVLAGAFAVHVWYFKPAKIDWFYDRIFAQFALQSPEMLSSMRILPSWLDFYSSKLDDASPAHEARMSELVRNGAETLHRYDRNALDRDGRLSYDVLDYFLTIQVEGDRFRDYDFPVNQMFGVQSSLPNFMAQTHQVNNKHDAEAYIARLDGFPEKFAQTLVGLKEREAKNLAKDLITDDEGFVKSLTKEDVEYLFS